MLKNFKEHWVIFVSALLLTILIDSTFLVFPFAAGDKYRGINIPTLGGSNVHEYLTRGEDVLEGHKLGNPVFKEGKDEKPDYYFTINEYALLLPVRWGGFADKINVVTLYNIYNFVGVFLLILLIYFFTFRLKRDKLLALTASLFVVGGYTMVIWHALFYPEPNIYGRAMYPYLISLAFFSYLIFLHRALKSAAFKYVICAGAVFGLLFYVAFFGWTFALAFNLILFCLFVLYRNWNSAKKVLVISGLGAVLGAYNLFRIWAFVSSPAGERFAYFSGAAMSRAPVFTRLGLAALLLCILYFVLNRYFNKKDENEVLIFALILAGWAALNQQIITGRTIQFNHYYWYFVTPLSILAVIYIFLSWISNQRLKTAASAALVALVFINTAGGQYKSALVTWDGRIYEQNYAPIINALNKDEAPGVILAADDYLQSLFAIYTPHDLFWHGFAAYNDIPLRRFEDALFVYAYLNKGARNDFTNWAARSGLYQHIEGYNSGLNYYEYQRMAGSGDKNLLPLRKKLLADLSEKYGQLRASPAGVEGLLSKYGVNYVVWDENTHPEWDLSFIGDLREIASNHGIHLYVF